MIVEIAELTRVREREHLANTTPFLKDGHPSRWHTNHIWRQSLKTCHIPSNISSAFNPLSMWTSRPTYSYTPNVSSGLETFSLRVRSSKLHRSSEDAWRMVGCINAIISSMRMKVALQLAVRPSLCPMNSTNATRDRMRTIKLKQLDCDYDAPQVRCYVLHRTSKTVITFLTDSFKTPIDPSGHLLSHCSPVVRKHSNETPVCFDERVLCTHASDIRIIYHCSYPFTTSA